MTGMDEMHEILAKSVQEKDEQVSKLQVQVPLFHSLTHPRTHLI